MFEIIKKVVTSSAAKDLVMTAAKTVIVSGIVGAISVIGSKLYVKSYLDSITKFMNKPE